jgi:hypothetical protein
VRNQEAFVPFIHSFIHSGGGEGLATHCEEAEGELLLVGRSERHHGDQVPQQQDNRELHGDGAKVQTQTHCSSWGVWNWLETYRDGHGAAAGPGRAPAGGAGALGVLRIAGSYQRRGHLLLLVLGLVLLPGYRHAVSAEPDEG